MPDILAALSLTTTLAVLPTLAMAQQMSAAEMLKRLEAQAEIFSEAAEGGDLGATRGLEFVTIEGGTPAVEATGGATVTASDGAVTDPNGPLVTATTETGEPGPVVFAQLDPDLQVNLQISFAFDSAAIEDSEKPMLDTMCQAVAGSDLEQIRIVGHTDSSGADDYNERLSILRAKEVARYMVDECGIAAGRLQTMGMGERFPLETADPRADENRRVEFQALS